MSTSVPVETEVSARAQITRIACRDLAPAVGGVRAATTVLPLVAAVLLLAGLGFGTDPAVVAATAAPLVWLVVLLATVPLARMVAADEQADDCWDLLRGLVTPAVVLAGKLSAQWMLLVLAWLAATVVAVVLLGVSWPAVNLAGGVLGALGLATVATLLGTLLLDDDGHGGGLLAVLMLPAGLPALLAGSQLASGAPPAAWLVLLVAYDAVLLTVAWAVFPVMVEGS